jgi:hypothetical protein
LNNPEQCNAITEQLLADLGAAFEAALADDGAGRSCSPARAKASVPAHSWAATCSERLRLMLENPYLQKGIKIAELRAGRGPLILARLAAAV